MIGATVHDGASRQHRRGGVPVFGCDGSLIRRVSREQAAEVVRHGGEWRGAAVYLAGIAGAPMARHLDGYKPKDSASEDNARGVWSFRRRVLPV